MNDYSYLFVLFVLVTHSLVIVFLWRQVERIARCVLTLTNVFTEVVEDVTSEKK